MRANGFTLVELLAAMTAGALLLASMSWVVMQLTRQSRQAQSVQTVVALSAAFDRVRTLVEGARAGPADHIDLSSRHLLMTTNPPMALGPVGLVMAELQVERASNGERLSLSIRSSEGQNLLSRPSRLLEGQRSIRFSWLADRSIGEREHGAVRLDVVDQAGRATNLVVPLVVTGDPNCVFDPVSLTCR